MSQIPFLLAIHLAARVFQSGGKMGSRGHRAMDDDPGSMGAQEAGPGLTSAAAAAHPAASPGHPGTAAVARPVAGRPCPPRHGAAVARGARRLHGVRGSRRRRSPPTTRSWTPSPWSSSR
jgi:hypothetical protein